MPTRIVLAAMAWLAASGMIVLPLNAAKKNDPPSSSLSQKNLRGSMQGQSGIVLDLNGDGREDLVVGAPYAHQKNAKGTLRVYDILYRDDFEVVEFFRKFQQFRYPRHGTVIAHDFADYARLSEPCESCEVNGTLCLTGSLQEAPCFCLERKDMPRP